MPTTPKLIVADEPTTALDVATQAQVLKLLNDLRRERGAALMFISHDFGVVAALCDRVHVMYAGRVVESGSVKDVLGRPRHPYTRARGADPRPASVAGRAAARLRFRVPL